MELSRFKTAQAQYFELTLAELTAAKKRSHWMWFMFPQLAQLGHSKTAKFYGLHDLAVAKEFLADPILGNNLRNLSQTLLHLNTNDPLQVFGYPDNLKLHSSMTLFYLASNEPLFMEVLQKFFAGKMDEQTIKLVH